MQRYESSPDEVKQVVRLTQRLDQLRAQKNSGPMIQLLYTLMRIEDPERRRGRGTTPQVFSEPAGGLSGIDRVMNPLAAPGESKEMVASGGPARASSVNDVTQRALLRGILYAFQVWKPVSMDDDSGRFCGKRGRYTSSFRPWLAID